MSTKENFKEFLKRNTYLSKSVNSGKTTYQKLFETYDIYEKIVKYGNSLELKKKMVK